MGWKGGLGWVNWSPVGSVCESINGRGSAAPQTDGWTITKTKTKTKTKKNTQHFNNRE